MGEEGEGRGGERERERERETDSLVVSKYGSLEHTPLLLPRPIAVLLVQIARESLSFLKLCLLL